MTCYAYEYLPYYQQGLFLNLHETKRMLLLPAIVSISFFFAAMSSSSRHTISSDAAADALTTTRPPLHNNNNNNKRMPLYLVVDFDGTCTLRDTTPLLPRLAARLAADDETAERERLAKFGALEQEYFALYAKAKAPLHDNKNDQATDTTTTTATTSLDEALDLLDDVSNQILRKVNQAGILQGLDVPRAAMSSLLQHETEFSDWTALRPDCVAVLARAMSATAPPCHDAWQVGVLSINWSPVLIEAALVQPILQQYVRVTATAARQSIGTPPQQQQQCPLVSPTIPVWCNRINAQGRVSSLVPGATAKRQRIAQIKRGIWEATSSANDKDDSAVSFPHGRETSTNRQQQRPFVVYVGDSVTDLTALVEADVGILIGESQSAMAMAEQWGIVVQPLSDSTPSERLVLNDDKVELDYSLISEQPKVIWKAESWSEIGKYLQALQNSSIETKPQETNV